MSKLITLSSAAAPLSIMVGLWMLAQISRRFGEVTHRPPLYRGLYVAQALTLLPLIARLLAPGLDSGHSADLPAVLLHDLPLALGITLSVFIAWRYWGWLVYAHEDHEPRPANPSITARK
ncbi:MAG: hypothetical protein JXJ20_03360 [Anaerolineae bacterium]|jgi:hypothetical protein|nr:hypothetical protein [Anaerolineae bacterium]